jgi:hypothetical protein
MSRKPDPVVRERNRKIFEACKTASARKVAEQFGVSLRTVRYANAQCVAQLTDNSLPA